MPETINGEKIKELRKARKLTQRDFADKIGITRELITKMESGKLAVSKSTQVLVEDFLKSEKNHHPGLVGEISSNGIVTRNPLLTSAEKGAGEVPYYDVDFVAGNGIAFYEDNVERPAYTMQIPGYAGCVAFPSYGDSMERLIKGGSILFGRKLEDWKSYLEYGQIYGIVMKDSRRFLKYIRKAEEPKRCFLLRSENEKYDDFEVPQDKIHNIWLIEGWMLKRA